MITASISETRRKLGERIELVTVTDRQARRLHERIDSEPRKSFRSADSAVKFLKKERSRKR